MKHTTMFLNNLPTVLILFILFQTSAANMFGGGGAGGGLALGPLDFSSFKSSCRDGELIALGKICIPETSKGVIQDPPALSTGIVG